MFKVLHFADVHCREKDLDEIKKCCLEILETAAEENPDLIVNAGDTFDDQLIRLDTEAVRYMMEFHRALADIAPVAVVIGTPSHDGKAALALEYATNGHHNIMVSSVPEQLFLTGGELCRAKDLPLPLPVQAVISMIPTPTKQYFQTQSGIAQSDQEVADAMTALFAGFGATAAQYSCPHILVGHFQVVGARISETQQLVGRDIEVSKNQIELGVFDTACLGHIHFAQEVLRNVFYSGSVYRLNAGEPERKGFYIHEVGRASMFIETPARKILKVEEDFTDSDLGAADLDTVLYTYGPDEIKDSNIFCKFKFWVDDSALIDGESIKKFFYSAGANNVEVKAVRVQRENVRSRQVLELKVLRDKILEQARLRNEAEVSETILCKADDLETLTKDQIIQKVANS